MPQKTGATATETAVNPSDCGPLPAAEPAAGQRPQPRHRRSAATAPASGPPPRARPAPELPASAGPAGRARPRTAAAAERPRREAAGGGAAARPRQVRVRRGRAGPRCLAAGEGAPAADGGRRGPAPPAALGKAGGAQAPLAERGAGAGAVPSPRRGGSACAPLVAPHLCLSEVPAASAASSTRCFPGSAASQRRLSLLSPGVSPGGFCRTRR